MRKSQLSEYHQEIDQSLRLGETTTNIARRLGVPRTTLKDYISRHADLAAVREVIPSGVPVGEVSREELLEQELRQLRSSSRQARALDVQIERVMLAVENAVEAVPARFEPPALKEGTHRAHQQALLFSDLHGGEYVDPDSVNGMNHYDWNILVNERVPNILQALASYREARPYGIEEFQVWMLGDMVSGANHAEITETNQLPIAQQAYEIGMLLGQFIEQLVPHYPLVRVYAVPGNHGRVPVKPQSKQVFNNFDWLAYKVAETYLSRYETVEFDSAWGAFQIARIAGKNILLFHGDGIRTTMPGVPWGGVMRRVNELRKQYAERGVTIHGFALGHFHQSNAVGGPIWMNGSVKGLDEYVLKNFGSSEEPTQLLLTFDPKRERRTDVSYINP